MKRFSALAGKRALLTAAMALVVVAAPRAAMAQTTPAAAQAPDPLLFTINKPVLVGWQVKPDKTKEFEEFWTGLKALIEKSENAELKAFGETLNKMYRVDAPLDIGGGNKAVLYLFQIDSPSTTHSYDPTKILYTYLGAGVEGSKVTRPEADALFAKLTAGFLAINPIWPIIKVG